MSGTSADGIDLVLVDFSDDKTQLIASYFVRYDSDLQQRITALYRHGANEIDSAFSLDIELAHLFAQAINHWLNSIGISPESIVAIGNHGQTIRHRPQQQFPFTLQIGCCQTLASLTGINVIGQFRRKDMALGGQGAPLVPAFHQVLFGDTNKDVFVVNIGGIANITYLPAVEQGRVCGFDTGPGNALLDDWYHLHQQGYFDCDGAWGASGQPDQQLFAALIDDNYFHLPAPKSTGREYFHLDWLQQYLSANKHFLAIAPENVQATLALLTATSISEQIKQLSCHGNVYLCGGGVHNQLLIKLLKQQLSNYEILITNQLGIDSDSLEAMAFAWLARAYNKKLFGNIPAVTGARESTVLGALFLP